MDKIKKRLEYFFSAMDGLQFNFTDPWRDNANRRTVLILIVGGAILIYGYLYIIRPPDTFPLNQLVTIPEGANVKEVADTLRESNVIQSTSFFRLLVRATGHDKTLHAGDYLFKEPRDIFSVARIVETGAFGLEPMRILVPEGATTKDMALIFSGRLLRFDKDNFLKQATPLEGYLFPDTYYMRPNATEQSVIDALHQNYEDHLETPVVGTTTLKEMIDESGFTEQEIVTIASIIEREAQNTKDRRLISGVIRNRLKKDMPLQVDVTFIYTLGKGTFQLTMADLTSDSPYNTYTHKGLPPTPIGSPSMDSLLAAVMPTKSNYLYFLADHSGVTHFCPDYACQQANKDMYF